MSGNLGEVNHQLSQMRDEIASMRSTLDRQAGQIGSIFPTISHMQERHDELEAQITDHESTALTRAHR